MGATPAITALTRAGIAHTVHRYRHDPRTEAYGAEAVAALADELGVAAEQVFKTLVVALSGTTGSARLGVAVLPVPATLSLKATAAALGVSRATMADAKDVTRTTGYVLGGVSPIGQRTALPTVVDDSALAHPEILVSAGRRGMEVALAPGDLLSVTSGVAASIRA
ncbi:Cys-tRNA(Pro) deacylase [Gordonia sinesedis]